MPFKYFIIYTLLTPLLFVWKLQSFVIFEEKNYDELT